ncbi:MAG TPA: ATP-binding cassette domain-containing protein [Candidatus Avacidaminococcus intestinavium]|uniref:ATP-binding cassette domain-containing protein n=1 Tax=Candidatus Avacidaminococcus intestinavium TaxID=2840684 RepID=A0A9D1MPP5_9FIRM|nr:ATP-binding cassette domain-containing protein [Candidatus Avacidaminococcus intestinavium]
MQLIVEKISKSFGINEIFRDVSFMLENGEKVGLVGVNGGGKSTLLKCLLAPETIDAGSIRFEHGTRIGYVEQGFGNLQEGTLWEYLLKAGEEILLLRDKIATLEKKLAQATTQTEELEGVLAEYAGISSLYEHVDGYNYEQRIKIILNGLKFTEEEWQRPVTWFSGGQKTRILLAAALVQEPDLLILDEPTNHLDIGMTEWLEEYLKKFRGTVLLVSHDRYFLNNVVTKVLEMQNKQLQIFKGNYDAYLAQKEIQFATETAAYAAQQEHIAKTEEYIRRFKAGIKSKMARGRQSHLDRLERLDKPYVREEFGLRLPPATESAERVIVLENLSVGYANVPLVTDINLVCRRKEKIALLGANGSGKSTLLKTILGELAPLTGRVQIGKRVQIGYFSQSYERLNPEETVLDNFLIEYGLTDEETRSLLGGMLFTGEMVLKQIKTLSGGQKARLVLLKLVLDGANLLILDEPTNHLDIAARETVEEALAAFDGTILLVSHDRYFISEIAGRIWEITNGKVQDYHGDYNYYCEQKLKLETASVAPQVATVSCAEKAKEAPKTVAKSERHRTLSEQDREKQLAKVELQIREQEALLGILEKQMSNPLNHATPEDSARLAEEYRELQEKIDNLMQKWEKLM